MAAHSKWRFPHSQSAEPPQLLVDGREEKVENVEQVGAVAHSGPEMFHCMDCEIFEEG